MLQQILLKILQRFTHTQPSSRTFWLMALSVKLCKLCKIKKWLSAMNKIDKSGLSEDARNPLFQVRTTRKKMACLIAQQFAAGSFKNMQAYAAQHSPQPSHPKGSMQRSNPCASGAQVVCFHILLSMCSVPGLLHSLPPPSHPLLVPPPFSLINVGSGFHCLRSSSFLFYGTPNPDCKWEPLLQGS